MSFIVVTYLGILVGIFILTWAIVVLTGRYFLQRKARSKRSKAPNVWVPFKPTPADPRGDSSSLPEADSKDQLRRDLHTRVQQNGHYHQNGHYTESKKDT